MRCRSIVSIAILSLVTYAVFGQTTKKNILEVAIGIEIQINVDNETEASTTGVITFLDDMAAELTSNDPDKQRLKACAAIAFLRKNGAVSACDAKLIQSDISSLKSCARHVIKPSVIDQPTTASPGTRNKTKETANYDSWLPYCNNHRTSGAPWVMIYVVKVDQFRDGKAPPEVGKINEKYDAHLVVVTSSFEFRHAWLAIFDARTNASIWHTNQTAAADVRNVTQSLPVELWRAVQGLLSRCPYIEEKGHCAYSDRKGARLVCQYYHERKGKPVAHEFEKFCLRRYSFRPDGTCSATKCNETCVAHQTYDECDAECGVGQQLVRYNYNASKGTYQFLGGCPGVHELMYKRCEVYCSSAAGIAMIVIGAVFLVLLGLFVFGAYWFLCKRVPADQTADVVMPAPTPVPAPTPGAA